MTRVVTALLMLLILSGGTGVVPSEGGASRAGGPEVSLPRYAVDQVVANAVKQTGETGIDEAVWVEWAVRACREGAPDNPEGTSELAFKSAREVLGVVPDPGLRENVESMIKVNGLVACRGGADPDLGEGPAGS